MIRQLEAATFLKSLGQGVSKPILILGDDYKRYVLKNEKTDINGNKQNFNSMFLNETLAYHIGCKLGVPMPEAVVVFLDEIFINEDPGIRFAYRFTEGLYFGSKELEDVEDNYVENMQELIEMGKPYISRSWNNFFDNIINKEDVSKILAFDILVGNFDRYGNAGNVLVNNTGYGRKVFAIDHGHAFFGPSWTPDKLRMLNSVPSIKDPEYTNSYVSDIVNINLRNGYINGLGTMFKALEKYIYIEDLDNHSFQEIVNEIEMIDEDFLDECFKSIPNEWFVDKTTQIGLYKKFILSQKNMVRHIIQSMAEREAFTNYRGGVLKWIQGKQFGTA